MKQVFTIETVSFILGICVGTVREWVWRKYIPSIKTGHWVWILSEDLEEFCKNPPKEIRTKNLYATYNKNKYKWYEFLKQQRSK